MKPSEKIAKIYNKIRTYQGGNKNSDKCDAIIQFLDEEYLNLAPRDSSSQ